MTRYLVVSYDTDEQQWFYDIVLADTSDKAIEWVCAMREYVVGADVLTVDELDRMAQRTRERTDAQVMAHMGEIERAHDERNQDADERDAAAPTVPS